MKKKTRILCFVGSSFLATTIDPANSHAYGANREWINAEANTGTITSSNPWANFEF